MSVIKQRVYVWGQEDMNIVYINLSEINNFYFKPLSSI